MQPGQQQEQNQQQQAQQQAQQQQMRQFLAQLQQQQQLQHAAQAAQAQRQQGQQHGSAAQAASNGNNESHDPRMALLQQQLQLQQAQQFAVQQAHAQAAQHQLQQQQAAQQQQQGHQQSGSAQGGGNNNAATVQWLQQMQLQQQLAAQQAQNHPEGMNWLQQQMQMQQQQQQIQMFLQLQQQQQQQQQQQADGPQNEYQLAAEQMQKRRFMEQQMLQQQQAQGRRGANKVEAGANKFPGTKGGDKPGANPAQEKLMKQQQQALHAQAALQQQNLEQQMVEQQLLQAAQVEQFKRMAAAQQQDQKTQEQHLQQLKHQQAVAAQQKAFAYKQQMEASNPAFMKQQGVAGYANGLPGKQLKKDVKTKLEGDKKKKKVEKKDYRVAKAEKKKLEKEFLQKEKLKAKKNLTTKKIKHENERKKRRVELQAMGAKAAILPATPIQKKYRECKVAVTVGLPNNIPCLFELQNTPRATVKPIANEEDMLAVLSEVAKVAETTMDSWMRVPQATWLREMMNELPAASLAKLYKKHRTLQTYSYTAEEVDLRWEGLSVFAESVLAEWFEGKSLDDVIARARSLGQMQHEGGVIIRGRYVKESLCKGSEPVVSSQLCHQLRSLVQTSPAGISVYVPEKENHFHVGKTKVLKTADELEKEVRHAVAEKRAIGSLNTTFNYNTSASCGVNAMDSFYGAVDDLSYPLGTSAAVELNKQMYLIWKLPNYMTTYHQDTHILPHTTLYQQTSGYSVFHFLPVLIGLYVTHVSKTKTAEETKNLLKSLDSAGIGSQGIIGPGDAAVIHPYGSHGVYVPSANFNSALSPFEVSQVRAAEFVINPVKDRLMKDVLGKDDWNTVLPERPEDKTLVDQAETELQKLQQSLQLDADDFKWVINRVWGKWQESTK